MVDRKEEGMVLDSLKGIVQNGQKVNVQLYTRKPESRRRYVEKFKFTLDDFYKRVKGSVLDATTTLKLRNYDKVVSEIEELKTKLEVHKCPKVIADSGKIIDTAISDLEGVVGKIDDGKADELSKLTASHSTAIDPKIIEALGRGWNPRYAVYLAFLDELKRKSNSYEGLEKNYNEIAAILGVKAEQDKIKGSIDELREAPEKVKIELQERIATKLESILEDMLCKGREQGFERGSLRKNLGNETYIELGIDALSVNILELHNKEQEISKENEEVRVKYEDILKEKVQDAEKIGKLDQLAKDLVSRSTELNSEKDTLEKGLEKLRQDYHKLENESGRKDGVINTLKDDLKTEMTKTSALSVEKTNLTEKLATSEQKLKDRPNKTSGWYIVGVSVAALLAGYSIAKYNMKDADDEQVEQMQLPIRQHEQLTDQQYKELSAKERELRDELLKRVEKKVEELKNRKPKNRELIIEKTEEYIISK
ncbi:MAG TPA: hypothetical protein VJB94_02945 [Candidatus Nanoarchaeia archaeon]|nr:hypothetical protein [Candidatus Nanoarchaeia archaeon]